MIKRPTEGLASQPENWSPLTEKYDTVSASSQHIPLHIVFLAPVVIDQGATA